MDSNIEVDSSIFQERGKGKRLMRYTETLENSHALVTQTIDDLPESMWDMPGVSGEWSVKDVLSHLTAYELLLIDALNTLKGEEASPYLLRWNTSLEDFNRAAVDARRYQTAQQVENEYQDAQVRSLAMLQGLPEDVLEKVGTLSWWRRGNERSAAMLIERFCEHTREHCQQIVQFRASHKDLESN